MDFKSFLVERADPFKSGFRKMIHARTSKGVEVSILVKAGFTGYGASSKEASSLDVEIFVDDKNIGYAKFNRDGDYVKADSISLQPMWRRKGISTLLYTELEKIGLKIKPSDLQTADGKAFWMSRSK